MAAGFCLCKVENWLLEEDLIADFGDRIFFAFNKAGLSGLSQTTRRKQTAWLMKWRTAAVMIAGNADERGTKTCKLKGYSGFFSGDDALVNRGRRL